jgi:copper transport protein
VIEPFQVGAKAALYAGVVLLLGAGVFARWIMPAGGDGRAWRWLRVGAWAGALLAAAGSVVGVLDALTRALGTLDPSMLRSYMTDTRDGNAVMARLPIIALVMWLGLGHRRPRVDRGAFVVLGLALLGTVSAVSHAGAQPGVLPVSADLGHLAGVTAWGGALLYGAWLLPWRAAAARVAALAGAARLSTVGLWSVTLIAATGIIQTLDRLWGPRALTETLYGRVLLVKLAVVAGVAALAGVNRWVVLPSLARRAPPDRLGGLVKVESLLFLAVLGVTSVLVVQAPPGTAPTLSRPVTFQSPLGAWTASGTLARLDPGRFVLDLTLRDAGGAPVSSAGTVRLTLTMLDMEMTPVTAMLTESRPGSYRGRFFLPMTGRWQMAIQAGGQTGRVTVPTEDAVFIQPLSPWKVVLPGAAIVLAGLAVVAAGLRWVGAGARPGWPVLAAGIALVASGVLVAVRAVS